MFKIGAKLTGYDFCISESAIYTPDDESTVSKKGGFGNASSEVLQKFPISDKRSLTQSTYKWIQFRQDTILIMNTPAEVLEIKYWRQGKTYLQKASETPAFK